MPDVADKRACLYSAMCWSLHAESACVCCCSAGSGDCQQEFAGHKGGVNALAAVPAAATSKQHQQHSLLLSAGKDHKLKLWDIAPATAAVQQQNGASTKGSNSSSNGSVRCVAECVGHKEAVQAVAAHPSGSWCCSGGWDGQLLLWKTGKGCLASALVCRWQWLLGS
jgi:WD40 repeat protein